jgi:hypothetical protein
LLRVRAASVYYLDIDSGSGSVANELTCERLNAGMKGRDILFAAFIDAIRVNGLRVDFTADDAMNSRPSVPSRDSVDIEPKLRLNLANLLLGRQWRFSST